jgi:uncharacterized protein
MSRETIEVVRHAYEAFNRGDLEDMAAAAAPEFEYVATGVIPGAEGVYRGREEYLRFLEQWWSEFDEPTVDVNELADAGEQVLASVTFRGGGKQSRVETTWSLWQLWTVRDGKIVRGQGFTGKEDALEAAAMRE